VSCGIPFRFRIPGTQYQFHDACLCGSLAFRIITKFSKKISLSSNSPDTTDAQFRVCRTDADRDPHAHLQLSHKLCGRRQCQRTHNGSVPQGCSFDDARDVHLCALPESGLRRSATCDFRARAIAFVPCEPTSPLRRTRIADHSMWGCTRGEKNPHIKMKPITLACLPLSGLPPLNKTQCSRFSSLIEANR
jgi:hypothetical protein